MSRRGSRHGFRPLKSAVKVSGHKGSSDESKSADTTDDTTTSSSK
jgi:hypothetical protein